MKGGRGEDTLVYNVSEGEDKVRLHGGKGTDTGIINTNGHSVLIENKKGEVLFASGGKGKPYTGGGTKIKVVSIENLDIRTPDEQLVVPEVEEPVVVTNPPSPPVSAHEQKPEGSEDW